AGFLVAAWRWVKPDPRVQFWAADAGDSRRLPLQHTGKRDGLAPVGEPAHPRDAALDSHPEARVGYRAVAAEIDVPVEQAGRDVVVAELPFEHGRIVLALPAADDLPVTLGREHVDTERDPRVGRIGLHVERLRLDRVAVHHDRTIEGVRERRLLVGAEIGTPGDR